MISSETGYNFNMDMFEEGAGRFNERLYFEAHESWEKIWLTEGDARKKAFIQGMIKIAAAFHHFLRGELAGTSKLLAGGLERAGKNKEVWEASFPEWDIERFMEKVKAFNEMPPDRRTLADIPWILRKPAHKNSFHRDQRR